MVINMKIERKRFKKALRIRHAVAKVGDCSCPLCSERVDEEEFRNEMFMKEFKATGLCQGCLDTVFGYQVAW